MGFFPRLSPGKLFKEYINKGIQLFKGIPGEAKSRAVRKSEDFSENIWARNDRLSSGAPKDMILKQKQLRRAEMYEKFAGDSKGIAATHAREVAAELREKANAIVDRTIPAEGSPEEAIRLEADDYRDYQENANRVLNTAAPEPVFGQEEIVKKAAQDLSRQKRGGVRLLRQDSPLGKIAQQVATDLATNGKPIPALEYLTQPLLNEEERTAEASVEKRAKRIEDFNKHSQVIHKTLSISDPEYPGNGDFSAILKSMAQSDANLKEALSSNKRDVAIGYHQSNKNGGTVTLTIIFRKPDFRSQLVPITGQSISLSSDAWFARISPDKRKKGGHYWNLYYGKDGGTNRFRDGFALAQLAQAEKLIAAAQPNQVSLTSIDWDHGKEKVNGKNTIWVTINVNGSPEVIGIPEGSLGVGLPDEKSQLMKGADADEEESRTVHILDFVRKAIKTARQPNEKAFSAGDAAAAKKKEPEAEPAEDETALF